MKIIDTSVYVYCSIAWSCIFCANEIYAQESGVIHGTIKASQTGLELGNANIVLLNTSYGTTSNAKGNFSLGNIPYGNYQLNVSYVGYEDVRRQIALNAASDELVLNIQLEAKPTGLKGVKITALQPNLRPETKIEERQISEANVRDPGEVLRDMPGLNAVRRGPIGLDPVIRGMRETQIGTYVDGARMFSAGPARMDSPLSHYDPNTIESIDVVKGPYALNWGSGNMSAIRVRTRDIASREGVHGTVSGGFDSNLNAFEGHGAVNGRVEKFGYRISGTWREGDDYESGEGEEIPADFLSREIRAKLQYSFSEWSTLTLSGGLQYQDDIDFPGRLLIAELFDSKNLSAQWKTEDIGEMIKSVEATVYINNIEHKMNNSGKPTAMPNPDRIPPFPLKIIVDAEITTLGGRLATMLSPAEQWNLELGGDIYSANREASRQIDRNDENPQTLFMDIIWPDATINSGGVFARNEYKINSLISLTGTVRLDLFDASGDETITSDFFKDNVSTDLDENYTRGSGALTLNLEPAKEWNISIGGASTARMPDALELYSDRFPAGKAQTSAEFVGNPGLEPERLTQADLWIESGYDKFSFSTNVFVQFFDDYVTLQPTTLNKRLPLSPPTVFQYINGEAMFWGAEASATYELLPPLSFLVNTRYLWGDDETLNEPALGVNPFAVNFGLRYEKEDGKYYARIVGKYVDDQERVATTRGEEPTDSYFTVDLSAGIQLLESLSLQGGIKNLFDEDYVNHLNAKNPFTGNQIPEPGRIFYVDIAYDF